MKFVSLEGTKLLSMKTQLWTYRHIFYNLLFGLYFWLLSPWLSKLAYEVFYEDATSAVIMVVALGALALEVVGLVLKVPGIRQVFMGGGLSKLLSGGVFYKIFMGMVVGISLTGKLVFGFFLILFAMNAFYGEAEPNDGFRNALIVYALVQMITVFILLIHSGMSKRPKHNYRVSNPPLHFMIRDAVGDVFLLTFSAIAFSIIWHTMFTNPNLQPIDYGNVGEVLEQAFFGFVLFLMMYLPANLTHFFVHTVSIRSETRLQRVLYWLSWLLTLVLALAPYF